MKVKLIKTKWKTKLVLTGHGKNLELTMTRPYLSFAPLMYYLIKNGKHRRYLYHADVYTADMSEEQILSLIEPNPQPFERESRFLEDLYNFLGVREVKTWTTK
ncbi:MAG: hypothetical protein ASUL_09914 [Candidatus Aramenus sulfurataquae]|uniref:Uncharacterized protein n=1 Tax=Candidatus Aramenus sulfurataquae TaxID=1326980 RepID=W7KJH1_9CREN|nr:MAG: hypothetical protein ASUL_09914 [Candidatus Aramenus sulfurataquae]